MYEYIKLVVELYRKELLQDRELFEGLIQEWIIIPRDTNMHTYMAMYGIFGCIFRVIVLLFVRIPVWWPMHMVAYLINCTVRYTFVPVFALLQVLLNRAECSNNTVAQRAYNYLYTFVQWLEWILKTVFLLTYVIDKIVMWIHNRRSVRGYIDYKIDQIVVKAHTLRNEKHKQGWFVKLLVNIKQGWVTYVLPVPRLVWQGIKITLKYINPLNYTWVKYAVNSKTRKNIIIILKCRVIIRVAIFKGLVAYGIKGWLWLRLCRWGRRLVHVSKVLRIKYYPRLAFMSMKYWLAFHIWWIITILSKCIGYGYIYVLGGLKWLLVCIAIISWPVLYVLLHVLYVINAVKIWYTHGIWVSKSNFYLMAGWNPSISSWKWHTRIK